jgi:hypothetical protein
MSFLAGRPPIPSKLFVHCPNLHTRPRFENEKPLILSIVDDFFLVRLVMMWPGRLVTCPDQQYDYFVYNPTHDILDQLSHPHPLVLYPHQVGLLPRGDRCTVAALLPTRGPFMYDLYLFNSESEAGSWESKSVRMRSHLRRFPIEISDKWFDLAVHRTSSVITFGGESATGFIGWADLWRDVLYCDVLHPSPKLHTVPVPFPEKQLNSHEGRGRIGLGYSRTSSGHCLHGGRGLPQVRGDPVRSFFH